MRPPRPFVALAALLTTLLLPACSPPDSPQSPRYTLTYDANGADSGAVPDSGRYSAGQVVASAGQGDLIKAGSFLAGWGLAAAGPPVCVPGSSFPMPPRNTRLYALWSPVTEGTGFAVVFPFADPEVLELPGPVVVAKGDPLNLSVPAGFSGCEWRWDGDLAPFAGQTGTSVVLDTASPTIVVGVHTLTVFANDAVGVRHSGSVQIRIEL